MTDPVQGNNDQFLLKVCKGALHRITWAVVGNISTALIQQFNTTNTVFFQQLRKGKVFSF